MIGLDWSAERYVRVYARDVPAWKRLKWQAQGVYLLLQRYLDRAGALDLGGLEPFEAVAERTAVPEEVAGPAVQRLVAAGFLVYDAAAGLIYDPQFTARGSSSATSALRQRESRAKKRDLARLSQIVTDPSRIAPVVSRNVSRDSAPQRVAEPSEPSKSPALPGTDAVPADAGSAIRGDRSSLALGLDPQPALEDETRGGGVGRQLQAGNDGFESRSLHQTAGDSAGTQTVARVGMDGSRFNSGSAVSSPLQSPGGGAEQSAGVGAVPPPAPSPPLETSTTASPAAEDAGAVGGRIGTSEEVPQPQGQDGGREPDRDTERGPRGRVTRQTGIGQPIRPRNRPVIQNGAGQADAGAVGAGRPVVTEPDCGESLEEGLDSAPPLDCEQQPGESISSAARVPSCCEAAAELSGDGSERAVVAVHNQGEAPEIEFARLAGRCADGAERDSGTLWHAIEAGESVALCGAEPGRQSAGWSEHLGTEATCKRCLSKLRRRAEAARPSVPEWATKAAKRWQGGTARELAATVCRCIAEVRQTAADPKGPATAARTILALWRQLEMPPVDEFEADFRLVAHAAHHCPDRLFSRDIRAIGWQGGQDRQHDVATIAVQRRWTARLDAAREWASEGEGRQDEAGAPEIDIPARLEALAAGLPHDLPDRKVYARAILACDQSSAEATKAGLREIAEDIHDELAAHLDDVDAAELDRLQQTATATLRRRLPRAEAQELGSQLRRENLRALAGLPVLSLYSAEAEVPRKATLNGKVEQRWLDRLAEVRAEVVDPHVYDRFVGRLRPQEIHRDRVVLQAPSAGWMKFLAHHGLVDVVARLPVAREGVAPEVWITDGYGPPEPIA